MTENSFSGRFARMKNRTVVVVGVAAFLLTISLLFATRRAHENTAISAATSLTHEPSLIAGPGRVEPAERVDTKILETLVELDPSAQLPDGLRVDAFILPEGSEEAEVQPRRF
jgi:hypothetical protein